MRIFLDLDDVVFNTRGLIRDLRCVYIDTGIPEDIFKACYRAPGVSLYSLDAHAACMAERTGASKERLLHIGRTLLVCAEKYVFPDMHAFFVEHGKDTTILSFGGSDFQKAKIAGSGIRKYVHEVLVTEGAKDDVLEGICRRDERFILIDDRAHHIDAVKRAFPRAIAIFVARPEGRYADETPRSADHTAKSGEDIKKIVGSLQ